MARGFKQGRYAVVRARAVGVYAEHSRPFAGARADPSAVERIALDRDDWDAADRRQVLLLHSARKRPESTAVAGGRGLAWKGSHAGGCKPDGSRRGDGPGLVASFGRVK